MTGRERAVALFRARFGADPKTIVRAPGRVNVIGEHTDYNDGFVLPAAIDRALWIALSPRDGEVEAASEAFADVVRVRWAGDDRLSGWGLYVQGVAWALEEAGHELAGWRGAIASDVPVGAGLSSSAAIELATARAFHVTSGFAWDRIAMARAGQRAENGWIGLRSGIMDQVACAAGRAGHALLLDCRSLEVTPVRLPRGAALVVLDSGTRRDLASSAYNERREECERAARGLRVRSLREVTAHELSARAAALDPVARRRARHVVTENGRTVEAAAAMASGDAERAGELMFTEPREPARRLRGLQPRARRAGRGRAVA